MIKLDFKNHSAAQDMIEIIKREKQISSAEAIDCSINPKNYRSIIKTGWADIALSMWGHADLERDWSEMENPCVEVELSEEKINILNNISKIYKVNAEIAVSYFLIFTMDSLGYHI